MINTYFFDILENAIKAISQLHDGNHTTNIAIGDEVTSVNKETNTYYTDERLSDMIAIRSYKDSKDMKIEFSFLDYATNQ